MKNDRPILPISFFIVLELDGSAGEELDSK